MAKPKPKQINQDEDPDLTLEVVRKMSDEEAKANLKHVPLSLTILKHWREFCPKTYRSLKRAGCLHSTVLERAIMTIELACSLWKEGLDAVRAREIADREYWLLTDKELFP